MFLNTSNLIHVNIDRSVSLEKDINNSTKNVYFYGYNFMKCMQFLVNTYTLVKINKMQCARKIWNKFIIYEHECIFANPRTR